MKITKFAVMLFAVSALAFAGCSKKDEKKEGDKTAATKTDDKAAPKTAENPCAAKKMAANPCAAKKMANPCAAKKMANPCAGGSTISDEDMEKAVTMLETIANAVDANKADCDKMAGELTKVMGSNKDLLAKMKASKDDKAAKAKFETKYKARMAATMGKMMGGMSKCATHEGVRNAMKAMQ